MTSRLYEQGTPHPLDLTERLSTERELDKGHRRNQQASRIALLVWILAGSSFIWAAVVWWRLLTI